MSTDRVVIGGTDCTDVIARLVAAAPPFNATQRAELGRLLAVPAVDETSTATVSELRPPSRQPGRKAA